MHIFCAAPIQSEACGQNGCLHASGHPGRYMRRRQRNGGSAWAILRRKPWNGRRKAESGNGNMDSFRNNRSTFFCGRRKDFPGNWQKFRTEDRLPCALGYRYGRGYTLLRKRNLFRLARQLRAYYRKVRQGKRIPISMATGLLSRLGQLRHCNSTRIYKRLVKPKTQRALKCVVRQYMKKERSKWNMSTGPRTAAA